MSERLEKRELTLGFVALLDCAPLVIAQELGFFEQEGLQVSLSRESSWANVRDKVSYGLLDGAHMLAGMPIAATLGLGAPALPMLTALSLNLGGNAITLSEQLCQRLLQTDPNALQQPVTTSRVLAQVIAEARATAKKPMRFGMVFPVSSHHYLLRYWLRSGGIDPDRDVNIVVVPPAQMVSHLEAGIIQGYCVGEPWNTLAVAEGLGRLLMTSHAIWNNHPEKVFAVTRQWAERHPQTHQALLRSLLKACRWLDSTENRLAAVHILEKGRYVNTPAEILRAGLTGRWPTGSEPITTSQAADDVLVFHRYAANFPWRSHALWFMAQMAACRQIEPDLDFSALAAQVYRPDLYRQAARTLGVVCPAVDSKVEGEHRTGWHCQNASLTLGADRFLDDACFDPAAVRDYIQCQHVPLSRPTQHGEQPL